MSSSVELRFNNLQPEVVASIDQGSFKINAIVPSNVSLVDLIPVIKVSSKATISPNSGSTQNFTYPVFYEVTSEDGSSQKYEVTVKRQTSTIPIKDIDNNIYETIKIGEQLWFNENLRTTKYNDGTTIPNITNNLEWSNSIDGAYSIYDNNSHLISTDGQLYNWYAVNTGKLCPSGWKVPKDSDWRKLTDFLISLGFDNSGIYKNTVVIDG